MSVRSNHVHVVVEPLAGHDLADIVHSWKSWTARAANEYLQRDGAFWQTEYYDHLVRDEQDLQHCIEYAYTNPDRIGRPDWRWRGRCEDSARAGSPCDDTGKMPVPQQQHGQDAHATTGRMPVPQQPHGQDGRGTPRAGSPCHKMPVPQQQHGQDAHATLILCGERATDGDTGQVGPGIAAWLDLPVCTYVGQIESVDDHCCRVHRLVEDGREVLDTQLPAVLTVVKEIAAPRLPTLDGKLRAKAMDVPVWTPADLDVDVDKLGLTGSPTRVVKIHRPKVTRQCRKVTADGDRDVAAAVDELVEFLESRGVLS